MLKTLIWCFELFIVGLGLITYIKYILLRK